MYSKFLSRYHEMQEDSDEGKTILLNQCFTNHNEEDKIYPLTVKEIVEAQKADSTLEQYFKCNAVLDNGLTSSYRKRKLHMPQRTACIAKDDKICDTLERNEETIRFKTKSCKTCQVNNIHKSMGTLPSKTMISNPWEALCVNLVGPYTLARQ
jgi:hypothetical protein